MVHWKGGHRACRWFDFLPKLSATVEIFPIPSCNISLIQSCQFAGVLHSWAISENSSADSKTTSVMFLSVFSPATAGSNGNVTGGSQYYTCCCLPSPVFGLFSLFFRVWVALIYACRFVVVMLLIWSLCNLCSGSFLNSIQVDLNHVEKLSVLMKTYVLLQTSCIHLQRDRPSTSTIMCLDLCDVNAPDKA